MATAGQPWREFHVSRQARDRYQFDDALFATNGNVVLADFYAARVLAHKVNEKRDLARYPEQAVQAGQINAMGLIDEILHHVVHLYRQQGSADVFRQALSWLEQKLGREAVDTTLRQFVDEFPPLAVYRREIDPESYLEGETRGEANREAALEELLMLWLANMNPAFAPFRELYDDAGLERTTSYREVLALLHGFFETQPVFGPDNQNLVDMLRQPALVVPHSLSGQLEYIRQRWGYLLGRYFYRLLSSLDLFQEEQKVGFAGPGPALVVEFVGLEGEPERFSRDLDWMPHLVLIAKNAYVWLDQLSRQYGRPIRRLDEIPDQELDRLAGWGMSGLWLIGVWERSPASQRIKAACGNPDAVASAYSVFEYEIAADLGGEAAFRDLRDRAWQRGIRLASDMVPNHMGIDSRWVIEHSDWFISLDYSPFPSYTFTGMDLSWDERVGIFLEDHYYDRTDAAVVFKRLDRRTGSEQYIYHGNDGTRMPWNDTAQLNYLKPEVREAVIQTILHVARKFPIIRFDAAMTLAKRHYQRLWFPEPGTGGAIPSRAEHGLSRQEFDAAMPEEFWREVVDRVAREAPDTLLLAEAFWLMEGYFVRTLGMHRVYNSAFMNMLRDELNANYRLVMKNTLEFDPEVLKRFVNFMNNPDEETAVSQFGKGDKYFGICTMMATLPGLPMFGHGQVEGFSEKYGMEFRHAQRDEQPDPSLVARHEREIFPLLHRRYLFAGVEGFLLYDFFTPEGYVNEDVFAYSNRRGEERALVIYHNRYATARGWVKTSVAFRQRAGMGDERPLVQRTLGEGLGLRGEPDYYCIFRDHLSGLTYIRSSRELCEQGLFVELGAYKAHVFLDFREVQDNEWHQYGHLASYLDGRGVPNIDEAMQEVFLQPIHVPFGELVNAGLFRRLLGLRAGEGKATAGPPAGLLLEEVEREVRHLLHEVKSLTGGEGDEAGIAREVRAKLEAALWPSALERVLAAEGGAARPPRVQGVLQYLRTPLTDEQATWGSLFSWLFTHALGKVVREAGSAERTRSWIDEWLLGRIIVRALREYGLAERAAQRALTLVRLLTTHQRWFAGHVRGVEGLHQVLEALLRDGDVQQFLQINRYQGILWFNKESFDQLLWWMLLLAVLDEAWQAAGEPGEAAARIGDRWAQVRQLQDAAARSAYQVERLLEIASVSSEVPG